MKIFKPYSNIKDFLYRFTILKIGKLHVRFHKIVSADQSTLYHNHPFHYISIILWGGYEEKILNLKKDRIKIKVHKFGSFIIRKNHTFHRIEQIFGTTITLFIAYGNYGWKAINTQKSNDDGLYVRIINNRSVWCKKKDGIWFIGNEDKSIAQLETRHSIHQIMDL